MFLDQTFRAAQLITHTLHLHAVFFFFFSLHNFQRIICLAPAISLIPDEWLN